MIDLVGTAVDIGLWQFLAILLLVFGLFLILAGIFTAYFGSGKSRTIGVALLVVGLVVGLLVGYLYSNGTLAGSAGAHHLGDLLLSSFLVILAAVIGALIAIGIFLVAIMKS
jgi:hypothetical protein